jgi:hypothetical protein
MAWSIHSNSSVRDRALVNTGLRLDAGMHSALPKVIPILTELKGSDLNHIRHSILID